ncbi:hypothetical protein PENSPDRAFT_243151 [Peniophora sp. CONT]|nr:hypothetical protein PENSPDRAFT_243151 [Peniophora sp. CONT]
MRGGSPSNLTPRLRAVSPDEAQADIRSSPIAEPEPTAADRWDWNYPPAVPTGRHTTRPGHLATKDSEDALELLYPDEDDNGIAYGAKRDAEEDYEREQGQEYDEYDEEGEGEGEGEGEEEEEDLQAVKDRQKNMFVSAAEVYSENGDTFDDDDGDAEAMEGDIPSPIRYRQEGTSFPIGDVYGNNNGGLFDTHSDSDSDIVEVSPPPTARKAVVSPILAPVNNAVSSSPAPEAEEEEEVLANPFGLPSFSAPAPAPVPALSTAQASAALNAAPALPLGVIDYTDEVDDDIAPAVSVSAPDEAGVDSAPALSALESLASQAAPSSPAGFSFHPAVWSPEETIGSEVTAGHTEDSEEEEDEISEVQEASGHDVESELRAQLGPDVVLAGDSAPSLFADDGMYTDPGAPAYVPATPAVLDEAGTPASEVEGEEEAAPSIAAMPTIEEGADRDPLEISAPDAENAPVPVQEEDEEKDEDDGMYTDPGAPAPVGEDAPMGYSAASSPLAPLAPSPAYVVEEPEDGAATPTSLAARTAREESVVTAAADGKMDKEYVVVEDDEEDEVDEVESVVSAAEAEVEEPGEATQEPGLSPVEEEEEDELVEDQQADDVSPLPAFPPKHYILIINANIRKHTQRIRSHRQSCHTSHPWQPAPLAKICSVDRVYLSRPSILRADCSRLSKPQAVFSRLNPKLVDFSRRSKVARMVPAAIIVAKIRHSRPRSSDRIHPW